MKKKLVLSLLVVVLLATLTTVALAWSRRDVDHDCPCGKTHPYSAVRITERYCLAFCYCAGCSAKGGIRTEHIGTYCMVCGLVSSSATTETVMVNPTTAVAKTTTGQRLIVRDKADFSGKVLGYLDFGAKVEVLSVKGGFARITGNCGGKTVTGYVWSKNLHDVETVTYTYEAETPQPEPQQDLR